jgi:hypothetical protein
MSSNIPSVANFDGVWYPWTPSVGPLDIAFTDGQDVRSLWFPIMPEAVSFSATPTPPNGNPFYIANALGNANGPETVPLPEGTQSVTLTAASTIPIYLFASSYAYNPFKGDAVGLPQAGQFSITFADDGTAMYDLVYPTGYTTGAEVTFTPKFDGVPVAGVTWGLTAESELGVTVQFSGGNPTSTINVGWISLGVV